MTIKRDDSAGCCATGAIWAWVSSTTESGRSAARPRISKPLSLGIEAWARYNEQQAATPLEGNE
jgi:hypothetical protein